VRLRLPGAYNVANAVLAVATCAAAGAEPAVAAAALAGVDVPGRVERVERGQDFLAVVDYAHKPAALGAVIDTLRQHCSGRIVVVAGAGGDRDSAKRPLMGEAAARRADLLIVTDDNPRTEDPAVIRAALVAGAHAVPAAERGEVREVSDRAEAIAAAVAWAQTGDVVLIAGKGHETGQEINGVKQPFDDRVVLGQALTMRRSSAPA
jgi:UDP-N-acetylmuramoyl-L-alanyl-D-glutamate--2,6-diaminopimelate ligase